MVYDKEDIGQELELQKLSGKRRKYWQIEVDFFRKESKCPHSKNLIKVREQKCFVDVEERIAINIDAKHFISIISSNEDIKKILSLMEEGYNYKEIGDIIGASQESVRWKIRSIRKKFNSAYKVFFKM